MKKRNLLLIVALILLITVTVGSVVAYVIIKTPSIMNIFQPEDPTGDLQITKAVVHPFGSNYAVPNSLEFTFRVELGEAMAGQRIPTSLGDKVADQSGGISVTTKPGVTVTVSDIPSKTKVTVTETNIPAGFAPESVSQTVEIPLRGSAAVTFRNTYTPRPAANNVTLEGVKELEGRQWQEGDSFTFALEQKQEDSWQKLGTATVTYDAADPDFNRFSFTQLLHNVELDRAGVYSFRVSEEAGIQGGITYDPTVSYLDITVTDEDMDGYLEITDVNASNNASVTRENDIYRVFITIRNTYAPAGSAEVTVNIRKTLEDLSGSGMLPAGFTFLLTDAQGNEVTSAPTGSSGETAIKLVYSAVDAGKVFTYTLKEVDPGKPGLTCDPKSVALTVEVIDDLDGTVSAVVYTDPDAKADNCTVSFHNVYDPVNTTAQIVANKTLTGREMKSGEFTFLLYPTADGVTIPEGTQPITAVNGADGKVTFAPITYDKVGTYHYVLMEKIPATALGVTYDTVQYRITVTVTDENGVLKAQIAIADIQGAKAEAKFANKYSALEAFADLIATKELVGAELADQQFTFLLYQADEQLAPVGDPVQLAKNDAEGKIAFTRIVYEQPGVYRYILKEDASPQEKGMTYDESVYAIVVTVTDDGKGHLEAEAALTIYTETEVEIPGEGDEPPRKEIRITWEPVEELVFKNTYVQPPTEPSTQPSEPTATTKPSETPPTGDQTDLTLYAVLLAISGVGLAAVLVLLWLVSRKRRKAPTEVAEASESQVSAETEESAQTPETEEPKNPEASDE